MRKGRFWFALLQLHDAARSNLMNYLNMNQLREKLGKRSRSSILRDIESGRLPRPVKIGARLYWNEADIDAKLAELAG